MSFLMIIHGSMIIFWDPQLCLILLPHVPSFMCVLCKPTTDIHASIDDSSTLVSQHDDCNRPCKSDNHKCKYCHKLGLKIDKCYVLHVRHPQSVADVQVTRFVCDITINKMTKIMRFRTTRSRQDSDKVQASRDFNCINPLLGEIVLYNAVG